MRAKSMVPGRARFELAVEAKHLNPNGVLHGGVIYSLADSAMGAALFAGLAPGEDCATLEIKMNYLAPVLGGSVAAEPSLVERTYRNPGLHAKSLTTIDHLSQGRVDCGLGAGWHEVEAKAFGYEFPRIGVREDMLEEYTQCMRLLLDPESRRASFAGKHFRLENAPNHPKPLQPRMPIWIG